MKPVRKAIALISGGLDSMLAAKMMLEQGIHVEGINFFTGFCVEGHTHAIRKNTKPKRNNALWVAEQLNIKLHIIDIVEEYKQIVLAPKHGYGANLNPCLDCKIFMLKKARAWLEANSFDFIVTGEVMGQRPMSQRKMVMPIVAKESGADDILVRPLSAKNLAPTYPETAGWIKRELLGNFTGRSRKPQFALAKQYGIDDYAQPAGGCCFLTDERYSAKLKDLWQAQGERNYELDDIMLLKVGRHIRPNARYKLIIGREEGENNYLEGYRKRFTHLRAMDCNGPLVLLDGEPCAEDIEIAARVTARFSDAPPESQVPVAVTMNSGSGCVLNVQPFGKEEIPKDWYI